MSEALLLGALDIAIRGMIDRRKSSSEGEPIEIDFDSRRLALHDREQRAWAERFSVLAPLIDEIRDKDETELSETMGKSRFDLYVPLELVPCNEFGTPIQSKTQTESEIAEVESVGIEKIVNVTTESPPLRVALIGHGGAGKTSTLKHVLDSIWLKPNFMQSIEIAWSVRCRHIVASAESLSEYFLRTLGIKLPTEVQTNVSQVVARRERKQLARQLLSEVLSNRESLLVIDGLDEVPSHVRDEVFRELIEYDSALPNAHIILSYRHKASSVRLSGFKHYEIQPLSDQVARDITKRWFTRDSDFSRYWEEVVKYPFKTFLTRPYGLIDTCIYFKRHGTLPRRPAVAYKEMLDLYLRKWDDDRGVKRQGHRHDIQPGFRKDLLAAILFWQCTEIGKKPFTEEYLHSAFEDLKDDFGFEEEDETAVLRDLQTYTGLVKQSGSVFEFVHPEINVYLLAEHLKSAGIRRRRARQYIDFPEEMAVFCVLARPVREKLLDVACLVGGFEFFPHLQNIVPPAGPIESMVFIALFFRRLRFEMITVPSTMESLWAIMLFDDALCRFGSEHKNNHSKSNGHDEVKNRLNLLREARIEMRDFIEDSFRIERSKLPGGTILSGQATPAGSGEISYEFLVSPDGDPLTQGVHSEVVISREISDALRLHKIT